MVPDSVWVFHKPHSSSLSLAPVPFPHPPNPDVRKRALAPPGMGTPIQRRPEELAVLTTTPNPSHPLDICIPKMDPLHPQADQRIQDLSPLGHSCCSLLPFLDLLPDPFPGPFVSLT